MLGGLLQLCRFCWCVLNRKSSYSWHGTSANLGRCMSPTQKLAPVHNNASLVCGARERVRVT